MTTSRIHILDKSVAERIAAGEVVERPASVVKELVENAIDAGARAISVEIRQGGLALMRVSDNGSGMSRADAPLAVERFATSKIATADDLNAIRTLGFRGEALPSIANVSQLEILTRARDPSPGSGQAEIEGTRVRVVDGKAETEVAGVPVGTQVTVRDLFYNAPARKKFLKSPLRETELISKTLLTYALAYPHIAFRLVVDGREAINLAKVSEPSQGLERIGAVWGREVAGEMVGVNTASVDLRVHGFVSRPTLARSSREWQMFFVNSRPVRSGLLAVMLERPYAGRLPPNRHPLAVINIDLDPRLVDMNVHPRKAEVRFYQERAIYGVVTQAVEEALRGFPLVAQPGATDWSFADARADESIALALREPGTDYRAGPWRAVGQIHNTYILAQSADGLVIVDQHAAQEQVYYEWLTGAARLKSEVVSQIELMPKEAELVRGHLDEYQSLGIEIEPFGENTFRVTAMPAFIPSPAELVTALVQEHERNHTLEGDALRDKLAAKAACLAAIKAGDVLTPAQQQALLDELMQVYSPATCPHGRPVFVMLRLDELERRFLRR